MTKKFTIRIEAETTDEYFLHKNVGKNKIRRTLRRGCALEYLKTSAITIDEC